MTCNGDCFNCIYDDCVCETDARQRESRRLRYQNRTEEEKTKSREYFNKWRKANSEKLKEYHRKYYQENKERCDARTEAYRKAHSDKIKEYQKRYREKLKQRKETSQP